VYGTLLSHDGRAELLHGVNQHPLRPAERPNGLKPPLADPVVDRAARYAQQPRGMVQRDAPSDTWFDFKVSSHELDKVACAHFRGCLRTLYKGTRDTMSWMGAGIAV
jgi:hypothetical protein